MKFLYALEWAVSYFLYCSGIYWIRRKLLERRGASVVLVYHRVLSGPRKSGEMVGEEAFEWQMRYLKTNFVPTDWSTMSESAEKPGEIKVLVTFDDGYRDNFTSAFPTMQKYGVPAVFFVVSRFAFEGQPIAGDKGAPDSFPTIELLKAAQMSHLAELGNHTASHRVVSHLGAEEIDGELTESQNSFQEHVGAVPELFAYPRGRSRDVTRRAIPVLQKYGFKAAFTMIPGRVDSKTDPYFVPRIGMSHVQDKVVFKVKALGMLGPLIKFKNRIVP